MKKKILGLIKSFEKDFNATGRPVLDIEEYVADKLVDSGVVLLPCSVGDSVSYVHDSCDYYGNEYIETSKGKVVSLSMQEDGLWIYCRYDSGLTYWHREEDIGKDLFIDDKS